MPRESKHSKALRLLSPDLSRLVKGSERGVAIDVLGDSIDKFAPVPYRVMRYKAGGVVVESCTCEGALHHPLKPQCSHVEALRICMRLTHGW